MQMITIHRHELRQLRGMFPIATTLKGLQLRVSSFKLAGICPGNGLGFRDDGCPP